VLQTGIVTTAAGIDTSSPTALKQRSVPLGVTRLGVVRQAVWAEVADVQTLEVAHKVSERYPTHKPTNAVNTHTRLTALLVWNPLLHTPYISSPNYYLPFATRAHAIAAGLLNSYTATPHCNAEHKTQKTTCI